MTHDFNFDYTNYSMDCYLEEIIKYAYSCIDTDTFKTNVTHKRWLIGFINYYCENPKTFNINLSVNLDDVIYCLNKNNLNKISLDFINSIITAFYKFDDILYNRKCPTCGKQIINTREIRQIYCNDECKRFKLNIKSNLKQRGYKVLSNGEFDQDISLYKIYNKYHGICSICNQETSYNDSYKDNNGKYPTIDHIIPVSKGGKTNEANLQLACRKCNCITKNSKVFKEEVDDYLNKEYLKENAIKYIEDKRCFNCKNYNMYGFIKQDNLNIFCSACDEKYFLNTSKLLSINEILNIAENVTFKDFKKEKETFNISGIFTILEYVSDRYNTSNKVGYILYDVVYILSPLADINVKQFNNRVNLYNTNYSKELSLIKFTEDNKLKVIAGKHENLVINIDEIVDIIIGYSFNKINNTENIIPMIDDTISF